MRKALYILGQLSDQDVEWLIAHGRREAVPAGAVLIHQGQPVTSLYLVLSGVFSVVDDRLGNKELARLSSGEVLGEMSFIDSRPPAATVRALQDAKVLALSKVELLERLEREPAFAARFYRALAIFLSQRLRATVSTLGYGQAVQGISDEEQADELDPDVLDSVNLAGARFDHILKSLASA